MSRILRDNPLKLLALLLVVAAVVLSLFPSHVTAQGSGRGWTVEQGGRTEFYPHEKWVGDLNVNSFTLTNGSEHLSVIYYGTFKATRRERR